MRWLAVAVSLIATSAAAFVAYQSLWSNPRVIRELREDPLGARAGRVMLLTLPSGKRIPVNYFREGDTVYAAADFPWWRELRGGGGPGSVLVRGETLRGRVRAVEDDPELRATVFAKLRPTAISWAGTLIVFDVE